MLYKFKSKVTGDLIMLEQDGRRMLEIIGKEPGATGIVLPEQMLGALKSLDSAIAKEEADKKAALAQAKARGEALPKFAEISLRQHTLPFMDMLRRCEKAGEEIVWGV
ncbi:MAG: DUF1840 domain-containing protein [Betaproteobacteria bacterium]